MLNKFAYMLLAATSMAPILLIYGLSRYSTDGIRRTYEALGAAAFLVVICVILLRLAHSRGEREQINIEKSKRLDNDTLAFLVSYAIPLVTRIDKTGDLVALTGFGAMVVVVLYQLQILHVNPLLGIIGYHFVDVSAPSGEAALLITRNASTRNGTKKVVRLAQNLWLEILD